MVLTKASNDEQRRPATRQEAAAARLNGGDGAPVAGDERGWAAELPLTTPHPTVVTATDDDDGDGGAAVPEMAAGGGEAKRRR
jgi:Domain of unknown function (DUF834).